MGKTNEMLELMNSILMLEHSAKIGHNTPEKLKANAKMRLTKIDSLIQKLEWAKGNANSDLKLNN